MSGLYIDGEYVLHADAAERIHKYKMQAALRRERMRVMRNWMMNGVEWEEFLNDHPEAEDWFDTHGAAI